MSGDEPQIKPRPRQRSWFSFSLRTLLIAMTICCVVLGQWVGQLIRQRTAVRHFYELTANRTASHLGAGPVTMVYRYKGEGRSKPMVHKWLYPLFGEEAFGEVITVQLLDTLATDEDLRYLADVPTVEWVHLSNTKVTDKGLLYLLACPKLRNLTLDGLPITDDGLAQLIVLKELEEISLSRTQITDAGLEHLAKLPNLKNIWLRGTAITDGGYQRLKAALPRCEIQADVPSYNQQLQQWSGDELLE